MEKEGKILTRHPNGNDGVNIAKRNMGLYTMQYLILWPKME
jgi:hypothetical protein